MFRNLVQIYTMLVCFIAAIVFFISIPLITIDLLDLTLFESRSDAWEFDNNSSFIRRKKREVSLSPSFKSIESWPKEKVTQLREEEKLSYKKEFMQRSRKSAVNSLVWLLSAGIFFTIHWILYRREKKNKIN